MSSELDQDVQRVANLTDAERVKHMGLGEIESYEKSLTLKNPKSVYTFMDVLGQGHFGKVSVVVKKDDKSKYACKEIDTTRRGVTEAMLQNEIATMIKMDHPHLMRITAAYKHGKILYIMMPLVEREEGEEHANAEPDLMTWLCITHPGNVSEQQAATIIYHTATAIKYLNDTLGSMHRDLKPENILVGKNGINNLQVTDFGMARMGIAGEDGLAEGTFAAGTQGYSAPEILDPSKRKAGKIHYGHNPYKVDIFSLGVILFSIMVKYPPFTTNDAARRGSYTMNAKDWQRVSGGCKSLCRNMMEHNQANRYDIDQVLADPWLLSFAPYN